MLPPTSPQLDQGKILPEDVLKANYNVSFTVQQVDKKEIVMMGHESTYQLTGILKERAPVASKSNQIHNYIYDQVDNLHIYVGEYGEENSMSKKLGVIKNDELLYQSKENIKSSIQCSSYQVTGYYINVFFSRSFFLRASLVYGLSDRSELLMFDLNKLKSQTDYKPVVINADTPLSDIMLDKSSNTIMCLNRNGAVSRINSDQENYSITQGVYLSGFSNKNHIYFTIAVEETVVIAASGKEKQNIVELLNYQSLKANESLLIPKSNYSGGALMKMKIFKKKQQHFILGATEWRHMYLLGVTTDNKLLLIDKKEYQLENRICHFDELIRSQNNENLIEVIVTNTNDLHHIVTIKINN